MKFMIYCLFTSQILAHSVLAQQANYLAPEYQQAGANIRLDYPQEIYLDPNESKPVKVSFLAPNTGELTLRSHAKRGLLLKNNRIQSFDLKENNEISVELELSAMEKGNYYVMFYAKHSENGIQQTRVFGIPVQVGDVYVKQQKTHDKLVLIPAQETIN